MPRQTAILVSILLAVVMVLPRPARGVPCEALSLTANGEMRSLADRADGHLPPETGAGPYCGGATVGPRFPDVFAVAGDVSTGPAADTGGGTVLPGPPAAPCEPFTGRPARGGKVDDGISEAVTDIPGIRVACSPPRPCGSGEVRCDMRIGPDGCIKYRCCERR